ncbi:zinc finger protein 62 homolog isoform X1 [Asterias rubens]|uniref:zinc finger protein 62 homolog isoform X1 n=2 Tax=Asterias rubens TaxID=7604 RepID=UPI0014550A8F|nr:zinc finger protein 62 homolog isoform X1 [Asterias rubens]
MLQPSLTQTFEQFLVADSTPSTLRIKESSRTFLLAILLEKKMSISAEVAGEEVLSSLIIRVGNSLPKATKFFKDSAPKNLPETITNPNMSSESQDSILETMATADDYQLMNNKGDDDETMGIKIKEENNNEIDKSSVYDFHEEDEPVPLDAIKIVQQISNEANHLFDKAPLQAQPHRIQKNLKTMHYECPYCSFSSLYYSAVSNHTLIHTGEKPYQCHLCNYRARQRGHILIHMRIHSGKKPFKCSKCSYSTIQRNHLRVHMQVHSKDRPFECPGCPYRSKHLSILQMHVKKFKHDHIYECVQCDYTSSRKHNLTQHMYIHTGAKPFKCDMCPYESSQKGHLNIHIRSHTREKPYKCMECPFASTVPKSLREHMCMHQGLRPYKCTYCSFSTSQSFSLKKHAALHVTDLMTFRCKNCNFNSTNKEDFLKHRKVHKAPKSYTCSICDFTTPFKFQYTIHMQSHDNNMVSLNMDDVSTKDNSQSSPIKYNNNVKDSPTCEMILVNGKLRKKCYVDRDVQKSPKREQPSEFKTGTKLKISVSSLVNGGKKTPTKTTSTKTTPTKTKLGQSEMSNEAQSRLPWTTQSPSSATKKKMMKNYLCSYCDAKILGQEDWEHHEVRHFKQWPEIV